MSNTESNECKANMLTLLVTCKRLDVLIALDKCEDSATKLTYLGIEIDTYSANAVTAIRREAEESTGYGERVVRMQGSGSWNP